MKYNYAFTRANFIHKLEAWYYIFLLRSLGHKASLKKDMYGFHIHVKFKCGANEALTKHELNQLKGFR